MANQRTESEVEAEVDKRAKRAAAIEAGTAEWERQLRVSRAIELAIHVAAGIESNPSVEMPIDKVAQRSVEIALALIAHADKVVK